MHDKFISFVAIAVICLTTFSNALANYDTRENFTEDTQIDHGSSRQKRFLYYTLDRRLTFPRGSVMVFGITFSLPTLRNLPNGYSSKMTVSFPIALNLDTLYWTADENPYGLYPDLGPIEKRSIDEFGSMNYLYGLTQKVFEYLGYSGKDCFKRAICELRQGPLKKSYGWVKHGLEWILTPSNMEEENNELFSEYHEAEYFGRKFDCSKYHPRCPISIFASTFGKDRNENYRNESSHSRQKRLIFMTPSQGFALPPSTGVTFSYTYKCPLIQFPPTGYGPDLQFSVPLGVSFDDLEWTSEDNPYGTWPDLSNLGVNLNTKKRSIDEPKFGSTSHLYAAIASVAEQMGYSGKLCLKRAICEMHEGQLAKSYGWFRKVLEWLLTPSISGEISEDLSEYQAAEHAGKLLLCHKYYKCDFSIFGSHKEEYRSASHHIKSEVNRDDDDPNTYWEDSDYYKYSRRKNIIKEREEEYVSFQETVKIHNMVEQAIRSARLGSQMYTNIM